ncbi:23S rRNA (cytosine1962-C5)-methyltransferase [Chitinophaga skermanii]|uniref:23S rRNA (Cytosine1962-C5)-methyltransferase n=2 Tax=Chitinophaga skermanii TaxID=331697 RepID=A0A327Q5U2_9BACT|nr:23S rRNA (cytosine1962-C5)-methyltransferase [Chitinophaga skermanii]
MFENRLTKVFKHLRKTAKRQGVTCYRVYDNDLTEFPLSIEIYEDELYVAEFKREHNLSEEQYEEWQQRGMEIMSKVLDIPIDNIYLRERKRKENRNDQYEKLSFESHERIVQEDGLKFKVNLTDYLDSGLFLDHRITRHMVREMSQDKDVLNLFCYTGSFSVYAAAGGAKSVTSVDLSKTYLSWAEENMQLNDIYDPAKHKYVHADVLQYLEDLKLNSFDLVVIDPPTFSNSKRMKDFMDVQRDHVSMLNNILLALRPGGVIIFSNNYRKFKIDEAAINAKTIKNITAQTMPFDFNGKLIRHCFRIEK